MSKIGIVLSGGLAKGAYQIGVLKAIDEVIGFDRIAMISASSVGVLNAYAFATGQVLEAEKTWLSMNFDSGITFVRQVLKGDYLDKCLLRFFKAGREIHIPLFATLLNTTQRKIDYVNILNQPVDLCRRFIRASVALPPFNKPMQISKYSYWDGALADNIPIAPFAGQDLDCIICVYFDDYDYHFENPEIDQKTIRINQQSELFMKNVFQFKHKYIQEMIRNGYSYGIQVLNQFFDAGELVPNYLERISAFNQNNGQLEWRVTCEVVTKELNRVTQKFLDRSKKRRGDLIK